MIDPVAQIKAVLDADAPLNALLTGGIYQAEQISRHATPAAFDSYQELLPVANLRPAGETPTGTHRTTAILFLDIGIYQRTGDATIKAAAAMIFSLLNDQLVAGLTDVIWAGSTKDLPDDALDGSIQVEHYQITYNRSTP